MFRRGLMSTHLVAQNPILNLRDYLETLPLNNYETAAAKLNFPENVKTHTLRCVPVSCDAFPPYNPWKPRKDNDSLKGFIPFNFISVIGI